MRKLLKALRDCLFYRKPNKYFERNTADLPEMPVDYLWSSKTIMEHALITADKGGSINLESVEML